MTKKKVLLIEDDLDILETTEEILEMADYEVHTANNGKLGIEAAKQKLPDIIVCDIMMPEMDGFGVLKILSRNPDTASIPFIFLTAKVEKSDIRKGMNLGADDYLTKPFLGNDLLDAIEVRLKKSESFKKESEASVSVEDYFESLDKVEGFESLSENRKTKVFKKKEEIYREGDYANYLYCIKRGKVQSTKTDEYGKELVCDIHYPNDFIGHLTLLEENDYHETATAMEETEVALIPKQDFQSLIYSNRDVSAQFIKKLSKNIRENEERLLKLAYTPVRERIAETLVSLVEKQRSAGDDSDVLKITREMLANIVGTAKESLIRILSDFRSESIIDIVGRDIHVLEIDGLKANYNAS